MYEMKDSGVEWIGDIPAHWQFASIGSLYGLRSEKVSDHDYPPLSVTKSGILPQLETVAKTDAHDDRKLVKCGDFVINSRSDRRGSCGISEYDGSVSLINTVLYPIAEMNPIYYNWFFHTTGFADEFYKWGHGIVDDLWTTGWQDMKNIVIISPPVEEQQKIADYLDEKCTDIDYIISGLKKQTETLEEYKKSLITETVTKGLNPDAEMKDSGVEWIGEIPEHWAIQKLKYQAEKFERGTSPDYTDEPMTKVVNQATFSKGFFDKRNIRFSKKNPDMSRGLLKKGDVLLASTGGGVLGKTYFFNEDDVYVADSHVTIVRTVDTLFSKYLYYYFTVNYDTFNAVMAEGSTNQTELQRDLLGKMPVPFPPVEEQKAIADYLDKKCTEIDGIISGKKQQIKDIEEYKKSLIYEVVTGKKEIIEKR